MSIASIMVAADDGRHAGARVRLAADLAHRFGARLIGVAACMPDYPQGYGETAVPMGMVIEEIRQAALDRLAGVEQAFRNAACLSERVEWRSDIAGPVPFRSWLAVPLVVGRSARGWPEGTTSYERFGFLLRVRWAVPLVVDRFARGWTFRSWLAVPLVGGDQYREHGTHVGCRDDLQRRRGPGSGRGA